MVATNLVVAFVIIKKTIVMSYYHPSSYLWLSSFITYARQAVSETLQALMSDQSPLESHF